MAFFPPTGVPTYTNFAAFPTSSSDGDTAIALDTDYFYIFNLATVTWVLVGTPMSGFTANRAVVTNSGGSLSVATTTSTEIGYVNGVTSSIQTQLNSKQASGNYITALTGGVTASGPGSAAATVVTNANLTGPITSVGNATAVAAQTGTGSTFAMQTSPSLTTPTIGVATATSINKVAITAPTTSATLTLADTSTLATSGAFSTTLTSTATTTLTLPTTGTLSTLAGVETLSNKALGYTTALTIKDGLFAIGALADTTKTAQFSCANITTATNRTFTFPDASGTLCLNPMSASGDIIYGGASGVPTRLAAGSNTNVLTLAGGVPTWAAPATSGTVTSVGMTVPAFLSIGGSPVTSSGTLALSYSGTALPVANGGSGVTSSTGTTNVVLSNGPTLVAPVLGTPASGNLSNCTSYPNVTQSVAGLVVSAGQLLGSNTSDAANSGNVGELKGPITRVRSASASLSTGAWANVTSTGKITLTAGRWLVSAMVAFQPGATTSVTELDVAISKNNGAATTAGTDCIAVPTTGEVWLTRGSAANVMANDSTIEVPSYYVTVANAATLDLYLVAMATFTISTMKTYGSLYAIRAS